MELFVKYYYFCCTIAYGTMVGISFIIFSLVDAKDDKTNFVFALFWPLSLAILLGMWLALVIVRIIVYILPIILIAISFPSQAQDSTKYSLPRYKVDRLIKIALKAKQCDSLVTSQEKLINDDIREQAKADSTIKAFKKEIGLYQERKIQSDSLHYDDQRILSLEKKQKRKWKLITIGLVVLEGAKIFFTGRF